MTKLPDKKDRVADQPCSAAILLFTTIADTTWRMFVPTIGGTIIGIITDHALNSAPVWTTIMIIVGSLISLSLIYLQMKGVRKND
jgi:uncharacterized membrane protein (Fun14 family)